MSLLALSCPEVTSSLGSLLTRQNLDDKSVTIGFKNWQSWDIDTQQIFIAPNLLHFIQPDNGEIVGIKVFGGEN